MTECSYKTVQRSANVFGEDDNIVIYDAIQRGINSVSEASDRTISPRHVQQHSQPDFPMLPSYRWFRISKHGTVVRMATNIMFALVPPIALQVYSKCDPQYDTKY